MIRLLAVLLAFSATTAFAQAPYPSRPINLIVAYATGGGTDLVARLIAPYVEKHLGGGAKIVVINRTGAGGEIARAVAEPEFVQRSRDAFAPLRYLAPADYAGELKQLEESLRKLWQEAPWSEK